MIESLFGLIPEASRGQQWVAEDFQLVNWGGYDGPHRVRFSPDATLLSGASGSGKSTLMDAYIALIMPHTTPFNGASNGGVVGRPRGQDQRNILSYARGKIDEAKTAHGTKIQVLRGEDRDTWTAIAMTWADRSGARFTALRAWYVPKAARTLEDLVTVRATVDGAYDLRGLEAAAGLRLARAALTAEGLTAYDTDRDFTARLHTTLGIGAAGDGHKAVNLLGRIQSGQQLTTVDELYKRLVLEEPETLAAADAVVAHFDELAGTHQRMLRAQQQVRALTPIREHRAAVDRAVEDLRVIESLGSFAEDSSPAALWHFERRVELLREVESALSQEHRRAGQIAEERDAAARAAEHRRDGLAETVRAAGGDRRANAQRERTAADARLQEARVARGRLDETLAALGETVTTEDDLVRLADRARAALSDREAKTTLQNAFAAAASRRARARERLDDLRAQREDAARHRDNIPERLRRARAALAAAVGLEVDDLPFVGELVEVRTEFEPWREAFNLALGGFATTMLIDADHLAAFREAVDTVRTPVRVRYEAVPTGRRDQTPLVDGTLPARLEYRPTPFTAWLKDRLARTFDYVCVETPRQLSQHRLALTITGQVAQGSRGGHGGQGQDNVLGFSNTRRLAALDEQIEAAVEADREAEKAEVAARAEIDRLDERRSAYALVGGFTWGQVDVAAAQDERDHWDSVIAEVTADNPEIEGLEQQLAEARRAAVERREEAGQAKDSYARLEERWAALVDEVDRESGALDAARDAGTRVEPEQAAYLDGLLPAVPGGAVMAPQERLAAYDATSSQVAGVLDRERETAQQTIGEMRRALQTTFETFLERWPNPNLHTDPDDSYADFEALLAELQTRGLFELEEEWRDSLLKLSGNDLTNLDNALARAVRDIRDRIDPINQILEHLPFADDGHRLRIDTQESQSAVRRRFRKELRSVRSLIEAAGTDAEREQVYGRMARLIDRMRRTAPDFADLVDVRNHVRVSAEKVDAATGAHVALYDHIGEKSGGESQELVAFILGAALRYQLGDAGAERPRYAPVFLDEAMIKADARFTGRAIGAWRGLGFQLIVGAPNDKHSAIEPYVEAQYVILKDSLGRSRARLIVGVDA